MLATALDIPVMVLIQLNRQFADRQDKRPLLSDIRESGAIEQDADFVIFCYRDYMYSRDIMRKTDLELIVRKNRHGESNVACNLNFDLTTQFIMRT